MLIPRLRAQPKRNVQPKSNCSGLKNVVTAQVMIMFILGVTVQPFRNADPKSKSSAVRKVHPKSNISAKRKGSNQIYKNRKLSNSLGTESHGPAVQYNDVQCTVYAGPPVIDK